MPAPVLVILAFALLALVLAGAWWWACRPPRGPSAADERIEELELDDER